MLLQTTRAGCPLWQSQDAYQIASLGSPNFSPNIPIKFSDHLEEKNAEDGLVAAVQAVPV